jgi:hypothetical protein
MLAAAPTAVHAQWLDYPTPSVPRTADGKPNLSAPAPRTADGILTDDYYKRFFQTPDRVDPDRTQHGVSSNLH